MSSADAPFPEMATSLRIRRAASDAAGMDSCEVGIIGGGVAGLSAALVLARAGRSIVVIDAGEPRNAPAAQVHGFLSRDGMPPATSLLPAGPRSSRMRVRSSRPAPPA